MTARQILRRHWLAAAIAAVSIVILGVAILLLRTMPPRAITMATGPEGGAYHEVGKFYRAILAREGVDLHLRPTAGALENLALLRNPKSGVDVALMQGGTANAGDAARIESLGTLFYEPLWLFYRTALHPLDIDGLRGLKVSIGPEGSGSRALALDLLKRSGVDREIGELLSLSPQAAEEKLLNGEIDAAMLLVSWDFPAVKRLLADERTELASLRLADAYVALFPYLSKLTVPAGVADLAKKQPSANAVLVGAKASMMVRKDLNAAIQYLLLNAAVQIHSGPAMFQRAGQFPAAEADRRSAQRGGVAVLQVRAAVPAELRAVLDRGLARPFPRPADSDSRRALSVNALHAGDIRLGDAAEDHAHLRRIAAAGSRDGCAGRATRSRRRGRAAE